MTPRLQVVLSVGPRGPRLPGEDDETVAEVYWAHHECPSERKRNRPGERPWAWWEFELGEPMPADRDDQVAFLRANDLLDFDEALVLDHEAATNGAEAG